MQGEESLLRLAVDLLRLRNSRKRENFDDQLARIYDK